MKKIKWPSNISQEDVLKIIERIVNRLSSKFKFGYYDIDDIKQEARIEALNGLAHYDEKRPLENFLDTCS